METGRTYKAIIVGAGPAGLIAGRLIEDCLLLDKKEEIGKPIQCGEGISNKALQRQGIKPDPAWICSQIRIVSRVMPNNKCFGRYHEEDLGLGYVINRTNFEKFLAGKIISKIKLNSRVVNIENRNDLWQVYTQDNQVYRSEYILGADGPNSTVRREVFPENENRMDFFPAIEYLTEIEKPLDLKKIEMFFDAEKYCQGYAWIFPKSKNTANIGLCGKNINLSIFNQFLEQVVKVKYGFYRLLENKSGAIPIAKPGLTPVKDKVLLIGDAAGLADPFFKGGMSQAMLSAKIAAQCISSNKTSSYKKNLQSIGLLNKKTYKAAQTFYSLDNQVFNELGEVLESKGTSYLKTGKGIKQIFKKPVLRKNLIKIFLSFKAWWKNRDYLW